MTQTLAFGPPDIPRRQTGAAGHGARIPTRVRAARVLMWFQGGMLVYSLMGAFATAVPMSTIGPINPGALDPNDPGTGLLILLQQTGQAAGRAAMAGSVAALLIVVAAICFHWPRPPVRLAAIVVTALLGLGNLALTAVTLTRGGAMPGLLNLIIINLPSMLTVVMMLTATALLLTPSAAVYFRQKPERAVRAGE